MNNSVDPSYWAIDPYEQKERNKIRLSERNAESAANGIRTLEKRLGEMGELVLQLTGAVQKQAQHLQALELLLQNHNVRMTGHGPTE